MTPGDWTFDGETIGVGNRVIARCGSFLILPDSERIANGHVMAASKELLAACEAVLAWSKHSGAFCEPEDEECLEAVSAAVAKARGT